LIDHPSFVKAFVTRRVSVCSRSPKAQALSYTHLTKWGTFHSPHFLFSSSSLTIIVEALTRVKCTPKDKSHVPWDYTVIYSIGSHARNQEQFLEEPLFPRVLSFLESWEMFQYFLGMDQHKFPKGRNPSYLPCFEQDRASQTIDAELI
jgi:hypothetical protein